MKKFIISVTLTSLVYAANAVTYMCVKSANGKVDKYDIENVSVNYGYKPDFPDQGTTVSGIVGGYTYVDLGLSVKWATFNVGATKPSEHGDYFAYGETQPKEIYNEGNYKYSKDNCKTYTKYTYEDGLKQLEPMDDAATVNWGSEWRIPTDKEIEELNSRCWWETTKNFNGTGVAGNIGISKVNGNMIFLPATGYYLEKKLHSEDEGFYWYNELDWYCTNWAYCNNVEFDINGSDVFHYRYHGMCIRAVLKE